MAEELNRISINTVIQIIFYGLIVGLIISFMLGYRMGEFAEDQRNINQKIFLDKENV